jgi:hypothetical protein
VGDHDHIVAREVLRRGLCEQRGEIVAGADLRQPAERLDRERQR